MRTHCVKSSSHFHTDVLLSQRCQNHCRRADSTMHLTAATSMHTPTCSQITSLHHAAKPHSFRAQNFARVFQLRSSSCQDFTLVNTSGLLCLSVPTNSRAHAHTHISAPNHHVHYPLPGPTPLKNERKRLTFTHTTLLHAPILPSLCRQFHRVDAVLFSHPDLAHMGALPYLVGPKCGLAAPIYSTSPVRKMGEMFLWESYHAKMVRPGSWAGC